MALAEPKILLSTGPQYNLGEWEEGKIYKRSFTISNIGDSEAQLSLSVSCGCLSIVHPKGKAVIGPKKSLEVKFTFNTEGMDGKVSRRIYIESNDPKNPIINLILITEVKKKHAEVIKRFSSFGILTIIGAGLIDGINPCAFTVLVFFISFLSFAGYGTKRLLILGISFISAVFLTYILLGVGLFKFMQSLEVFATLSKIVYFGIAALAIVLGIYSLYDWHIYRKTGNPEEIKLRLPDFIKFRIQKIIQDSSRNSKRTMIDLTLAVFLSGVVVSLLESICTGQTYVPTIAYVLKTSSLRVKAIFYLVLYNLMFITPLVIIFITALLGANSEVFSKMGRKYLGSVKLLTAFLFFLLGILLFVIKKV